MEKLVLIDGNSLINRAFYAMPILSTKDGTFTNAVYGFMNMFLKMISEEKPTYIGVAFDLKAPTFRHKLYAEYKGTRKPMPEELRSQIPLLKDLLKKMGIKTFELEGCEADDIIGTLAKATDVKTIIITGDKDSFQLIDEQTEVHFTKRGITDVEVYTAQNFLEKTQITPIQIIDLKALMGDSSDNIPGIAGVGEKTAKDLLIRYQTIENLYEHTNELKGKLQEKIISGKETAFLSKTLATIDCNCKINTDLNNMRFSLPFPANAKKEFKKLELKSLYSKDAWFEDGEEVSEEQTSVPAPKQRIAVEELNGFSLSDKTRLAITVCADGVHLSDGENEYHLKTRTTLLDDGFDMIEILKAIEPILKSERPLITFNKKWLRHFIKDNLGCDVKLKTDDVAIIKYLADFSGRDEKLEDALDEYGLDITCPAFSLYHLYEILMAKLKTEEQEKLYYDVELPLADVLFEMEESGFKIDYAQLQSAGETYKAQLQALESEIRKVADEPTLNVNSPKQLGDVLFEKLKIAKGKKTKLGYSTTAEILESLEDKHEIVPLILKYRQIQKIHSTYIEGFKPLIDKRTGLIHTTFNQTLTATGRLSSKEPNLQNIPIREQESGKIRQFFIAKDSDRILVSADYSQIELRLMASFSKCKTLIDAFNSGKDVHTQTASKVFKVAKEEVNKEMRSRAKAVNFGIIYGISEFGLAKQIKTSNAQAKEFIEAYFSEYPEVKEYMQKNVAYAKETGYAKTLLGRKRYIKELSSSSFMQRQFGERVAMNMPLQGSSADIIKIAMLGVSKRLKEEGLKSELILQVHDELIIDAFKSEQKAVEKILIEEMEGAVNLSVKLTVEVGSGERWFDAK